MGNGGERQDIYAACLEAAVAFGTQLAPRLAIRAGQLMLQRAATPASAQAREALVEAERFLSLRQEIFAAAYPAALRAEFTSAQAQSAPAAQALSFESLELMREDQVDETVEVLRGQQAVRSEVETELALLNALISAVQGLRVVSAAANSFRPESWVRALRAATMECRVPAAMRALWLHELCEALGPELASGYRLLSELLRRHGVTAASFVVNPAGGASAGTRAPAPVPPTRPAAAAGAPAAAPLLNVHDLRRLLSGEDEPDASAASPAAAAAPPDHAPTVPWAFDALQEMKGVDQVLQRMKQRRASGRLGQRGPGNGEAHPLTPAQALGQEVVRVMVENIATDPRLPAPVRQAILKLEPALLRLAGNDPRFFRDKDHPTRRFLAEITERSLAWPAPDQPGFAGFFEPVEAAVGALAAAPMDTAEPFELALQSLAQAWAQEETRVRAQRVKAAQALIHAEKRNMIALGIADELRRRPDVEAAPGEIRRFVTGPWSQVIAAARMRDGGAAQAQAYSDIINDLIWSTQPRLASENRSRLARLAPSILATLQRGLASIEYAPAQAQHLLAHVGDLHRLALGSPAPQAAPLTREQLDARIDEATQQTWLQPTEARDSGLMDWSSLTTQAPPGAPPASGAPLAPGAAAPTIDRFRPGVWVDLLLGRTWSRWRLAWAGSHSLLFMFTDGAGGSRSVTRTTLQQMISEGAVRLVSEQPVLAGALDAVASRALRNSVDTRA